MNKRTEDKLKDLSGMNKAISELLGQAWERGYKYGYACGIENAPTVDTYTEDDVKTAIKEGHQVGYEMAKAKFERPTGEWKQISPAKIYECTNCGRNVMTGDIECYQFCHSCGADMRKEAEND